MTVRGYARVSSANQARYGNGMDVQEAALRAAGAEVMYRDVFTGTRMDRPDWDRLMEDLQEGDTLVVSKLDRIARTSSGGFEAVKGLLERGISVRILNMGLVDNTPTGRLILNIMFSFAEFERDMIVERMADGKAAARQREGFREGRPRIETDSELLQELVQANARGEMSVRDAALELGVSERTFRRRRDELLAA